MLSLRSSLRTISSRASLTRVPFKAFSDELVPVSRARAKIIKDLTNEIASEESNKEQEDKVNSNIQEFLESSEWELTLNTATTTRMTLSKQENNMKISVYTNIKQNPTEDESNQDNSDGENENSDEEGYDNAEESYTDFMVSVENIGKDNTLIFDVMTSNGGTIDVNNFFVTENLELFLKDRHGYPMTEKYFGPSFDSLDDMLQASTISFLKSIGVNEELGDFLEKASVDLENRHYVQWLSEIRDFFE